MKTIGIVIALMLTGCGYSARQNELTGQVKKVVLQTPILCGDRVDADVSLGVLRNGVGSMSNEDVWLTVPKESDQAVIKKAAETGQLVKLTYDLKRFTWCWWDHIVTHAELAQ